MTLTKDEDKSKGQNQSKTSLHGQFTVKIQEQQELVMQEPFLVTIFLYINVYKKYIFYIVYIKKLYKLTVVS